MNRSAKVLLTTLGVGLAASLWTACIQTSATTSLSTSGSSGSGVPTQTPTYTPTSTSTPACVYGGSGSETILGPYSLTPTTSVQLTGPWNWTSNQWIRFNFAATAGITYTFSVCQSGGSHSGDTYFVLWNTACSQLASNDDYSGCSLGSQLTWTAGTSGSMIFQVRGFGWVAGNATIAYWHN